MSYFNLQSERLQFRKLNEDDIPAWQDFFVDNPNIHFLGIDPNKSKEALAQYWIQMQLDRYEKIGLGHIAAISKKGNHFIGMGGIIPRILDGKKEYEIAFSLFQKYWRKGYGTEIARTLKRYGEQHINTPRFISIIHIENIGSQKVAVKNGMSPTQRMEYLGMTVDIYST